MRLRERVRDGVYVSRDVCNSREKKVTVQCRERDSKNQLK